MKGLLKAANVGGEKGIHDVWPSAAVYFPHCQFQLRSLTIPITKASKEGNLMAKVTVRLVFTIKQSSNN